MWVNQLEEKNADTLSISFLVLNIDRRLYSKLGACFPWHYDTKVGIYKTAQ